MSILLAQVLVFFVVFNTILLLWLLGLSFHNFSLTGGQPPQFVGFQNYVQLRMGRNNLWGDLSGNFEAMGVTIQTLLGVGLGLPFWGRGPCRGGGWRSGCCSRR